MTDGPSLGTVTLRYGSTLEGLIRAAGELVAESPAQELSIDGIAYDSREVGAGDLFFCIPGAVSDGHLYAAEARSAGAAALVVERRTGVGLPEVVVSDARKAMARMSASFFGDPADRLQLLGVTGTNGKTTTAYLLDSIARAAGRTTGLIGTIETRIGPERMPGVRTTPESLDLHRLFARMVEAGVETVAMEVTSHALVLDRVEGLCYASSGFTNLSQDHLDFHADMDDYFAAKRSLFRPERSAAAATNVDDPHGRKLYETAEVPCVGFGHAADAEVRATDVRLGPAGSDFLVTTPRGSLALSVTLAGAFNVYNCLAATAVALQAGYGLDDIRRGLTAIRSVPGRFESVDAGQPFSVIVDYAHTPDSLDNVLRAARRLADGAGKGARVLCVFGCGGDRDRGKRPLMGAVAARLGDYVVVTSDNPRSEDPVAIIDQILEGFAGERSTGPGAILPDRREAIAEAIGEARPGDVLVIAGKGHERGQQFDDVTIPFDDRSVAREELHRLGWVAQ